MNVIIIEGYYGAFEGYQYSLMSANGSRQVRSVIYTSAKCCRKAARKFAERLRDVSKIEDYTHKDYPKITELRIAQNDKRSVATEGDSRN